MIELKVTTWNIEHFAKIIGDQSVAAKKRKAAIAEEIRLIDPDILCIIEGPGDLTQLESFVEDANYLNESYRIPVIEGTRAILGENPQNVRDALADLYKMKGTDLTGNQWIWFLVKDKIFDNADRCYLQDPVVWDQFVRRSRWPVHFWGDMSKRQHMHWRHPQVFVLEFDGARAEFIGLHLKSKINRKKAFDANGNLLRGYVEEGIKARIKLATEAANVRDYLNARFNQEEKPRIFVMGDANDGPGKRFFERQFLFFDLISNIQGNVFFTRTFLNHCLFDFPDDLRWSTKFRDPVEPENVRQLLDHILFTQPLVQDDELPRIDAGAGFVEHTIHDTINATLSGPDTSDHRPVSVKVKWKN